jgi:hypothetical protein
MTARPKTEAPDDLSSDDKNRIWTWIREKVKKGKMPRAWLQEDAIQFVVENTLHYWGARGKEFVCWRRVVMNWYLYCAQHGIDPLKRPKTWREREYPQEARDKIETEPTQIGDVIQMGDFRR